MTKKVIALDLDEVVVETATDIIAHYNANYGTSVELRDYYSNDYKIWEADNIDTAIRRINGYLETDEYTNSAPVNRAIEVIKELEKRYELYIVTGRADFTEVATRRWLAKHFPEIFKDIVFTNFYDPGKVRHKGEICVELGANLLIDDHLGHILNAAEAGIEGLLFGSYPWNETKQKLPSNVRRVKDWDEVAKILL